MIKNRIVLVIGGGIAAYKCLDLIRRLRERDIAVRTVMTAAAQRFVTPLAVGAISGEPVLSELFDLDAEREIGHIRLSREAALIVVAPATADLLAKMAAGHADDLATAVLLATDKPVLVAPAMNPFMWRHPATRRNVGQLQADGIRFVGPDHGPMAEPNEDGPGRMAEPVEIAKAIQELLAVSEQPQTGPVRAGDPTLAGRHLLITAGPTHEPIDPVRYLANRSSGKQGYAIARAAAELGASVTLISGPVALPPPPGVTVVQVETARDMLQAVKQALPADAAVFTAAVADWRVADASTEKIKKGSSDGPSLSLVENPDILRTVAQAGPDRPRLVVGFAAETHDVETHAQIKLRSKGCDWILANDVRSTTGIMGGDHNRVTVLSHTGRETWPELAKDEVAARLVARIAAELAAPDTTTVER